MTLTRTKIWKAMEERQELEACRGVSTPQIIRRRAALLEYAHAAMFGKFLWASPGTMMRIPDGEDAVRWANMSRNSGNFYGYGSGLPRLWG